MDEFFQRLREIQKKERSTGGLANVGDNFYKDVCNYLNKLILKIGNNPFSFESYLLRDARRIAAEICERREHKITNNALLNVQRSRGLFDEKSNTKSNAPAIPPSNLTPEEEELYFSLTKSILKYRKEMISPLNSFKAEKKIESPSEEPEITSRPHLSATGENLKSKKRPVPLGIEHDIESFQAYEQPEFETIQNKPNVEKKVSKVDKSQVDQIRTLIVLEELPSIMGVDKEVYGPLSPQDIVTMPEPNAQILIKSNKGKFIEKYEKISYK